MSFLCLFLVREHKEKEYMSYPPAPLPITTATEGACPLGHRMDGLDGRIDGLEWMMDGLLDEWIDEAMGVTTIIRAFKWSRGHSYFPELPRSHGTKKITHLLWTEGERERAGGMKARGSEWETTKKEWEVERLSASTSNLHNCFQKGKHLCWWADVR